MINRIALLFVFFFFGVDSIARAQSFLDSEDRRERFRLKALNLQTSDCRGFVGYQMSPLSFLSCLEDSDAAKKNRGFLNLSWVINEQSKRKLVGSFPADFPVFHESYYFGSQGEPRVTGSSALAEVSIQSQPFSNLAFAASFLGLHDFEKGNVSAQIQKLYFEGSFRSFIFSFGRQPLFWGQSFVNPLLIADSAQNMDMLRFSTKPFRWGSFLKYLGDLKAEFFLSRMEEDRVTTREWFMGWRVGLMPTKDVEINFSYLYQFGGKGIPDIDWLEFMFELIGTRLKRSKDDKVGSDQTNRSGSMDFRWKFLDGQWPSSFYMEHHLEDCCGTLKVVLEKSYSYLYGFEILAKELWGQPLLQFEYVKTTFALYRHHRWRSGLSRLKVLMGHPMGRDSQGLYAFVKSTAFHQWSFGLSLLWEEILRTGRSGDKSYLDKSTRAVSEKHWGLSPSIEWNFNPRYRFDTQLALIFIKDREFQKSSTDLEWMFGLRFHADIF